MPAVAPLDDAGAAGVVTVPALLAGFGTDATCPSLVGHPQDLQEAASWLRCGFGARTDSSCPQCTQQVKRKIHTAWASSLLSHQMVFLLSAFRQVSSPYFDLSLPGQVWRPWTSTGTYPCFFLHLLYLFHWAEEGLYSCPFLFLCIFLCWVLSKHRWNWY